MTFVDQLEDQRLELEARRLMLEERYKLRLATAQEFGVIHTRRLDRVRQAFAKQCSAAERRNQDTIQRARKAYASVFDCGAHGNTSVSQKRLSHHTKRLLSAARRLYPAWHERQLQNKATELRALEEKGFMTEQRRRVARDRFDQERTLEDMVEERRRRLTTMLENERNECVLRLAHRDRAARRNTGALLEAIERTNGEGSKPRREARSSTANHHSGDEPPMVSLNACPGGEFVLPEAPARCIDITNAHQDAADAVFEHTNGDDNAEGNPAMVMGKRESCSPCLSEDSPCKVNAGIGMATTLTEEKDRDNRQLQSRSDSSFASLIDDNANIFSRTAAFESRTPDSSYRLEKHSPSPFQPFFDSMTPERKGMAGIRSRPKHAKFSPPLETSLSNQRGIHGAFPPSKQPEDINEEKLSGDQGCPGGKQTSMAQERAPGIHATDKGTFATVEALSEPSGSEDKWPDHRRCRISRSEPQAKGPGIAYDIPLERERCASGDGQKLGKVGRFPTRPCLSLPAAARALTALIFQIEELVSSCTEGSTMISSGYRSAMDAEPLIYQEGPVFEATVAYGEKVDGYSASGLEKFDLNALCGAALNLVTAHATEILPVEALTGVVNVAKVRMKHRHDAFPGKIRFFDALVRHLHHLSSQEGVDPSSVVDVFAPCFETVVVEGGRDGRDRLRRKICAFLKSAAAIGLGPKTSTSDTLRITPIPAVKYTTNPTVLPGDGRGEDDGIRRKISAGEVIMTMASEASKDGGDVCTRLSSTPVTDFYGRRARQQQQKEDKPQSDLFLSRSQTTLERDAMPSETSRKLPGHEGRSRKVEDDAITIAINDRNGARSTAENDGWRAEEEHCKQRSRAMVHDSGKILGVGGMVTGKKKLSLDLSMMGVEMGAFPVAADGTGTFRGKEGRQLLPELEVNDSLEG